MNNEKKIQPSMGCDLSVVKNLRGKWGLSADELAEKAGLTRGTILKIEAGQGNPTLQTIVALARVFRMTPSELVRMAETETVEVGRCQPFQREGYGGDHVRFPDFELFHLRLPAGVRTEFEPELHENTWELCFVLAGLIRLNVAEQSHDLGAGTALRFKALHDHRIEVLEDSELMVIHYNLI